MSKTNLEKIKYFDPKGMRRLAEQHKAVFINRVTEKGLDHKGRKFKKYSDSYTELIGKGFSKKDGGRLKAYKGFPVGGKTTKPNLVLRGLTMGNLSVGGVKPEYYTLQFTGEAAEIIEGHRKKYNIVDGLPNKEWDFVLRGLGKLVDREWKKIPNIIVLK